MDTIVIILALCGGALLSVQAAINGRLGSQVGVLAVQRIGTATATVAVIFGQLTMSLLIDNFGWLGNSTMAFSPARLAAVICLALALYLIYTSGKSATSHEAARAEQ